MTRSLLGIAFDAAVAAIEPACPSCGAPNPDATGFLLLGPGERITHCELCGSLVGVHGRSIERAQPWGPATTIIFEEPDSEVLDAIRCSGRPWSPLPEPKSPT